MSIYEDPNGEGGPRIRPGQDPSAPPARESASYTPTNPYEVASNSRYLGLQQLLAMLRPDRSTNDMNNAMTAMRGAKVARRGLAGYGGLEGRPKANMLAEATDPAMQNWMQANAAEDARYSGLVDRMQQAQVSGLNDQTENALWWRRMLYDRNLRDRAREMNVDWSNRQTSNQLRSEAYKAGGGLAEALADLGRKKGWFSFETPTKP